MQFWSPGLRRDVLEMKRVQRRATKVIRGLNDLNYKERLQTLNVFSLEKTTLERR